MGFGEARRRLFFAPLPAIARLDGPTSIRDNEVDISAGVTIALAFTIVSLNPSGMKMDAGKITPADVDALMAQVAEQRDQVRRLQEEVERLANIIQQLQPRETASGTQPSPSKPVALAPSLA